MNFAKKFPLATLTAVLLLWLWGILMAAKCIYIGLYTDVLGQDAHAYWLAAQGDLEYSRRPGERDAYLYSPAFLTLIGPLAMLPWPLFLSLWISLEAAVLVWLLKPLRAKWSIPAFLLCTPELVVGNIYILLAAAAVVGIQKPVAWVFPILTKVTPGVGLLWFAARGEWRSLTRGLGGLVVVVLAFYMANPPQWQAWFQFLMEHREGTPDSQLNFFGRCLLGVSLVVLGARKHWPWLIAPAMVLVSPVLVGLIPYAMLAAIPRLIQLQKPHLEAPGSPPASETVAIKTI